MSMPVDETRPFEVPPPPVPAASTQRRRRTRKHGGGDDVPAGANGNQNSSKGLVEELAQVEWMICEFKTKPCTIDNPTSHDHRCCPFYHSGRDRRRPMQSSTGGVCYKGEPCGNQFDDARTCAQGDDCTMCHSTAELLYHPDFFRKRLCHQARRCPRSRFCAFAHNRQELLVPHFGENEEDAPTEEFIIYRFKTQWCPVGGPHDWENCVYAHTYRDWRRVPILGYTSHPCTRWTSSVSKGKAETNYTERCMYGMACPLAHGAKEQLYHPQFYKTSPCSDSNCTRGPLCAFTHGEDARPVALDDLAAKHARRPIPGADEILKTYQPTFVEPPMYHALEDQPRGGASGAKGKKKQKQQPQQQTRSAPGSISLNLAAGNAASNRASASAPGSASINLAAPGDASQRMPQMSMPVYPGINTPMPADPSMIVVPGPFGPCVYQWVPDSKMDAQFNGFCPMPGQMPYAPQMMSPMAPQMMSPMKNPGLQLPPQAMGAPAFLPAQQEQRSTPAPMDSPMRITARAEAEAEAAIAAVASRAEAQRAEKARLPCLPNLLNFDASGQVAEGLKGAERDLLAWQRGVERKYCQKDGYRTPSSWGSPPLSNQQSATNSPRCAQSTELGDDALREEAAQKLTV